jgi:hypothetical protein
MAAVAVVVAAAAVVEGVAVIARRIASRLELLALTSAVTAAVMTVAFSYK